LSAIPSKIMIFLMILKKPWVTIKNNVVILRMMKEELI
jgi:hypothetical protein